MPNATSSVTRVLARLLGAPSRLASSSAPDVLDGNTAIAVTEACIAGAAGLGGSFPANQAEFAWQTELKREGVNLQGEVLTGQAADGARGALAATLGLAMAGRRATAFLSGPDLATAQDLLVMAAGHHLPLVVHLVNRALAAHAVTLGSGHEAYHLCADSGFFLLFAANVQEAVDLTLVARRVTELALVPGLVAMDGDRTALASQEVHLPRAELVREFLGWPQEQIHAPTPAQKMLFGNRRRRVPRWHDQDRPVLQGALEGPQSWALGAAARAAYFDEHVPGLLAETFELLSERTGRGQGAISAHRLDDAEIVLIVQGAATETAEAAAEHVRRAQKLKVGVLGVRCLRPFPGAEIVRNLKGKRAVAVLERAHSPLAGDPPLLSEVRAAVDRAMENARFDGDAHPGYVAIRERERPRLCSVVYGMGGAALRGKDLVALAQEMKAPERARIYLGLEFAREHSRYPKRQVLFDALRQDYPQTAGMGLKSTGEVADLRASGAVSVAVHRISGQAGEGLAVQAADLLSRLLGGQVRSLPGLDWEPWGGCIVDRFTHAPRALRDPGDEHPMDVAVLAGRGWHPRLRPAADLRRGAALLIPARLLDELARGPYLGKLRSAIREQEVSVYCVGDADDAPDEGSGRLWQVSLLGGLFGVLVATGTGNLRERRVLARREDVLRDLTEHERSADLEAFKTGLEGVRLVDHEEVATRRDDPAWDHEAPALVRRLGTSGEGYSSLPRFWSQLGAPYRDGENEELSCDPFLATGTVPALSTAFRDHHNARSTLPVFDPEHCTGCARCWAACPDSAIGPVVLSAQSLVEAGVAVARADALRSVTRLAPRIHHLVEKADSPGVIAGDLIDAAWQWVREKMAMPDERRRALEEAIARLRERIGALRLARTDAFFLDAEEHSRGSGELLSVVVDPEACKGCGLCSAACATGALTCGPQDGARVSHARELWSLWEQLPDISTPSLERASKSPAIDPIGAALLARRSLLALPGGDGAEPASGERLAVRLVLAIAESLRYPPLERLVTEVNEVHERIPEVVRTLLTEDLPTDDLDSLAEHLAAVDSADSAPADAERLRRLVEMGRSIEDLRRRLNGAGQDSPRARFSLVVAPCTAAAWAGAFPHNPFRVPVVLDASGDTVALAMGLLEGQLQHAASELGLLRAVRRELDEPGDRNRRTVGDLGPGWRDLAAEQCHLLPPLLLVGSDQSLTGKALGPLQALLGSDLPVKVIALSDLDLGLDTRPAGDSPMWGREDRGVDVALLALAGSEAFVVQTSLAETGHFLDSVRAALDTAGPALIHVHAPSPARHGFRPDRTGARAAEAVLARAFPLFRYDPCAPGVFGSRLNLEGNPQPREAWVRDDGAQVLTAADWALGERRFAAHFVPLDERDPAPTPVWEYLELDAGARTRATPFVTRQSAGEHAKRYRVDDAMVAATEKCVHRWRTLQELAGLVTPFTARIESELRELLGEEHEAELAALESDAKARVARLGEETQTRIAEQITARLMALAGYRAP